MENIYFYKMTVDNGGAPCVYDNILSLAICKPGIRLSAVTDDWIIGFGAKSTIGERLIYIAQMTDKIEDGRYYKLDQYFDRPDCIYRWDEKNKIYYWKQGKSYHQDGSELKYDLGKSTNVLISDRFIYFGSSGTDSYKEKYSILKEAIEGLRQGYRVNHSKILFEELRLLIEESLELCIKGIPTNINSICGKTIACQCINL